MKPTFNNFNIERERAEHTEEDWRFGALSQSALITIPEAERTAYLSHGEQQSTGIVDTSGCVSRAFINVLAPIFTYGYQKKLFTPKNLKFLEQYADANSVIDFSDHMVEIGSETTRAGNSLKSPIEYIRKNGLIPKTMLPTTQGVDFDTYYNPAQITQAMKDLGDEFAHRFTINYEQVSEVHFKEVLKEDFLVCALYAWPDLVNGEYPRSTFPFNHAVAMFKTPAYYIFDNYTFGDPEHDYIKKLAPDYDFYEFAYRPYISAQNDTIGEQISLMKQLIIVLTKLRDLLLTR